MSLILLVYPTLRTTRSPRRKTQVLIGACNQYDTRKLRLPTCTCTALSIACLIHRIDRYYRRCNAIFCWSSTNISPSMMGWDQDLKVCGCGGGRFLCVLWLVIILHRAIETANQSTTMIRLCYATISHSTILLGFL